MNFIHNFVRAARNQGPFVAYLPMCKPFKKYYVKLTTQEKAKINGIFQHCDHMRWERMDFLTSSLTVHFKRLHKVCCMSSVPLSAYILLCQWMRNEINKGLNAENGKFNWLLDKGAVQKVVSLIKPRFNTMRKILMERRLAWWIHIKSGLSWLIRVTITGAQSLLLKVVLPFMWGTWLNTMFLWMVMAPSKLAR